MLASFRSFLPSSFFFHLGSSWLHLGPSWLHLGPSWLHLGPSWLPKAPQASPDYPQTIPRGSQRPPEQKSQQKANSSTNCRADLGWEYRIESCMFFLFVLLVQSFSYPTRRRKVHKKSPKIDHNNREKKSIFRKKDARRETNIWAKKGGPSCTNPRVVSIDFVPEWRIVTDRGPSWRKRPSPTDVQNPSNGSKRPYTHTLASNSDRRSLAQANSLK